MTIVRKVIAALLLLQGCLIFGATLAQAGERSVKTLSSSKIQSAKVTGISGSRPDSVVGGGVKAR
jgi:hypothetical protein